MAGAADSIIAVAIDGTGTLLAAGSADKTVRVWDLLSGTGSLMSERHAAEVTCVAFHPLDGRLASGSKDGNVIIWNVAKGATEKRIDHQGQIKAIAFTPDGKHLISAELLPAGGAINSYSTSDWQESWRHRLDDGVEAVAIDREGQRIAIAPAHNDIEIRSIHDGDLVVRCPSRSCSSVAFTKDGRRIVAGESDKTVRIWDASNGQQLLVLRGDTDAVGSVAVSPDGKMIVSGGLSGVIYIWDSVSWSERYAQRNAVFGHRADAIRWVADLSEENDRRWPDVVDAIERSMDREPLLKHAARTVVMRRIAAEQIERRSPQHIP